MKNRIRQLLIINCSLLISLLTACDDLFEPANDNFKDLSQMYDEPSFGQSFLIAGYSRIPGYYDNSEYATDDAVTNSKTDGLMKMATGTWTASNNPMSFWNNGFASILYLNTYIANGDSINYVKNVEVNQLMRIRTIGEAYGLRALHYYYLLRAHGGYGEDGSLLGVPLVLEFQDANADFNLPRETFADCVKQIESDLQKAEELLPDEYNDLGSDEEIPQKFRSVTTDHDLYNRAMGRTARLLFNGVIAKAMRSRLTLMAASPAFQDGSGVTWAQAAQAAAQVIDYIGGVAGMSPTGVTYYANDGEIGNLKEGLNPQEMIWRENIQGANNSMEKTHYPPSLFGEGRMNPTQNLVDAFPMQNGYPIGDARSGFDPKNPFAGRDPRLAAYIIYDGQPEGPAGDIIRTGSESGSKDGINNMETSTRTGYYMKKRLRMDVNCNPSAQNTKQHYNPRIRATEIFLNYAEAANEAYGPAASGGQSYSAYDVIKAIRQRAGIGLDNGDPYLEECKADKEKMRQLIRNERRLELCFESFRFWDLRRWKADLTETARGLDINGETMTAINVEPRAYKDYMYYGPIPYSETLKYGNLVQNQGWK